MYSTVQIQTTRNKIKKEYQANKDEDKTRIKRK